MLVNSLCFSPYLTGWLEYFIFNVFLIDAALKTLAFNFFLIYTSHKILFLIHFSFLFFKLWKYNTFIRGLENIEQRYI